jgi:CheY-like chemotaxis protein
MSSVRVTTVRLVSWDDALARARARELKALGFKVEARPLGECGGVVGHFRDLSPDAVVLDLDRLPSHGREVGTMLRDSKSTRHLPLVFAGGAAEKVERIRGELPDAVFTAWDGIGDAVKAAIAHPVANPVKAKSHADRSAATPLVQKLGIKAGMLVAVLGGFDGFEELLGDLPQGASLGKRFTAEMRLGLYVVRSERELSDAFEHATGRLPEAASLWIIYPKQTKKAKSSFNENDVRELGLESGFVDYKVCAVNAEWSGLKFSRRRK